MFGTYKIAKKRKECTVEYQESLNVGDKLGRQDPRNNHIRLADEVMKI